MNLDELKGKFVEAFTEKGNNFDGQQSSNVMTNPTSVFKEETKFANFVKQNLSSLGAKNTDKIPNSISEILKMANAEHGEEFDISELNRKLQLKSNPTSEETTFNKEDYSKNYIKNTYYANGSLNTQEASVYSALGVQKSKYITQFNADGDVDSQFQIQYGANNSGVDEAIGYTEQGEKGDCWLLATINSLSYTDKGKEIIKNAISQNSDGSYSVDFKGVNTQIKITQEELNAARQSGKYSKGDDDLLLFELAYESVLNKIHKGEIQVPQNHPGLSVTQKNSGESALAGGNLEDAIFLLTGNDVESEFKSTGASTDKFDKMLSSLKDNPGNYAALIGFGADATSPLVLKDINGKEICTLPPGTNHAFSIKSVDDDGVTIVNPWDSSKEYKISLADARKFSTGIQYYALDNSFKETDSLDSSKLDAAPTQSDSSTDSSQQPTGGTQNPTGDNSQNPTGGTQNPTGGTQNPTGGTQNPTGGTQNPTGGTQNPTGGTQNPTGGTQNPTGGTQNPTGGTQNPTDGTQTPTNINDMSLDQLKAQKGTSQNELQANQDKYNAVIDGTDSGVASLKQAADTAYNTFQESLKKVDKQLSDDYDAAKKAVEAKQKEIDENDKKITDVQTKLSAAETRVANAEAKITSLNASITELQNSLSSASEGEKAEIQAKISQAKAQLAAAQKEKEDAIKERDALKAQLEPLNATKAQLEAEMQPLKAKVTELEGKISSLSETSPELKQAYEAYQTAENSYETGKADAAKAAKEAITAKQDELNAIDKQIATLENQELQKQFTSSKAETKIQDKVKELGGTGNLDVQQNSDGTYTAVEKLQGVQVSYSFDKDGNLINYTNAMGTFQANGNNVILKRAQGEHFEMGNENDSQVLEGVTLDDVIKSIKSSGSQSELFIDRALNEFDTGKYGQSDWCVVYSDAVFSSLGHPIGQYSDNVKANNPQINHQTAKTGDIYNNGKRHIGMVLLNVKTSNGDYITITADHTAYGINMNRRKGDGGAYYKGISA